MASTKWTCSVNSNKTATLMCDMDDGVHPRYSFPVKLRGVCYSPCPMNGSNKFAPAIGDWYWDSFKAGPVTISGWQDLWARDWPNLDALSVNTLRVYCMLSRQLPAGGGVPDPWNSGQLFTHTNFLDKCWSASVPAQSRKFVLVGIPMPDTMLWKDQYDQQPDNVKTYWMNVLRETAQQVGQHPAVMGFTIQNEQDGASVCYADPVMAKFWWGQVEAFAKIVKEFAPNKLVGMATHDDPNIPLKAASYMATCKHIDYWGVNTYQTVNFDAVFGPYAKVERCCAEARNPDRIRPARHHATRSQRSRLDLRRRHDSGEDGQGASATSCRRLSSIRCRSACTISSIATNGGTSRRRPISTRGGAVRANSGFPNGYWDNDGFGLFSIQRGPGLKPSDSPWGDNGPRKPIDVHTKRQATFDTMANVFSAVADNYVYRELWTLRPCKICWPVGAGRKNPAFKVAVGPASFTTVTTQQVGGGFPWQVTQNPTGPYHADTNVKKLPAVIAFEPNYLTAVAY